MRSLEWCYVDELERGDYVCDPSTEDESEVEVIALDLVRVPSGQCEWLVRTTGPTIQCPVLDQLPRRSPRRRALLDRPQQWFESTTSRLRQSMTAGSEHVRRRVPSRSLTDGSIGGESERSAVPNAPGQPDAPSPTFRPTPHVSGAPEQELMLDPADAKALGIALVRASVEGQPIRIMVPATDVRR